MTYTLGDLIKNRSKEMGVTPQQIAKACDVNIATVYKWMAGTIGDISGKKIASLASVLNLDPAIIVGDLADNEIENLTNIRRLNGIHANMRMIPIYGEIVSGTKLLSEDDIVDYASIPSVMMSVKNAVYFGQYQMDDSMSNSGIKNRDLVVFRRTSSIENGKTGCFVIGDKAICKRYNISGDTIFLVSSNPLFPPIVITKDTENFHIVGELAFLISIEEQ